MRFLEAVRFLRPVHVCRSYSQATRVFVLAALLTGCGGATSAQSTLPESAHQAPVVQWESWNEAAFARAQREGRLVIADIGTNWCPWCRVMDQRTYSDASVRALLGEHFVTIREDAAARPDIGERFRRWGWPATVFMSAEGEVLEVLRGYRTPERFAAILRRIQSGDTNEPTQASAVVPATQLGQLHDAVSTQLDAYYQSNVGGWGRSVRYPLSGPVEQAFVRADLGDEAWEERALQTLRGTENLIDPLWGGMGQLSPGQRWDRPAWDIITWLNAGALNNFAQAFRRTGQARYREAAEHMASFARGFLRAPDGAFYASRAGYRVDAEGRTVSIGARYIAAGNRERRLLGVPAADTHVYPYETASMALALIALTNATGDEQWATLALAALEAVEETHGRGTRGYRHVAGGVVASGEVASGEAVDEDEPVQLLDQAAMGRGAIAAWQHSADPMWLRRAEASAEYIMEHLIDDEGALLTSNALGAVPTVQTSGLAARFLVELSTALGSDEESEHALRLRAIARRSIHAVDERGLWQESNRSVGQYLMAIEALSMQVVHASIVGSPRDPGARALYQAAQALGDTRTFVSYSQPGLRYPRGESATLYLCSREACSSPIDDVERVMEEASRFYEAEPRERTF